MRQNIIPIVSAFLVSLTTVSAADISLFTVVIQPGWPVVAAPLLPSEFQVTNATKFSWSFPSTPNDQSCQVNGKADVQPCEGRAIDHIYPTAGRHSIQLTITDPGLSRPIIVKKDIDIPAEGQLPTAYRPEVRSLDSDQWQQMVNGLYMLREIGVYDHLARLHKTSFSVGVVSGSGTQRGAAHSSPAFLPWHRVSTRITERCLQTAMNNTHIGMPYWEWQYGWDKMEQYFGGSGNATNQYAIPNGPFCQDPTQPTSENCPKRWPMPEDFTDSLKVLKRQIGYDRGFRFQTTDEFNRLMSIPYYDLPPFNEKPTFNSFRNALEGWLTESGNSSYGFNHNGIHRWMGGTMMQVQESFHDPLFLVHHCNVDRLFTIWQQRQNCTDGRGSNTCYRPGAIDPDVNQQLAGAQLVNGQYAIVGSMFNDPMFPWRLKPSDVLKSEDGYKYLDSMQKLPPAPRPTPKPSPPLDNITTAIDDTPVTNPPVRSSASRNSMPIIALIMGSFFIYLNFQM